LLAVLLVQRFELSFSGPGDPPYMNSLADAEELLFWILESVALVFPRDDLKKSTSEVGFY